MREDPRGSRPGSALASDRAGGVTTLILRAAGRYSNIIAGATIIGTGLESRRAGNRRTGALMGADGRLEVPAAATVAGSSPAIRGDLGVAQMAEQQAGAFR